MAQQSHILYYITGFTKLSTLLYTAIHSQKSVDIMQTRRMLSLTTKASRAKLIIKTKDYKQSQNKK